MQLTQNQLATFIKWLEARWGSAHKCICGHDDWLVSDKVFELKEYHHELTQHSVVQPVIAVICKHCGHTVYVNAIVANVVQAEGGTDEKK